MNSSSEKTKEKKITQNEDKYPIIWFLDKQNMHLTSPIQADPSVHVFEKSKDDVVKFAQSLARSFLLIISKGGPNEKKLLENLGTLEDVYERSLTDFEKASVLTEISAVRPGENTSDFGAYLFYTRRDFESEILENEDIEEVMKKDNVPELAKVFREEFIFWERRQRGLEKADAVFQDSTEGLDLQVQQYHSTKCKSFCMNRLRQLVLKRNHEKEKIIYYVNLGESCQKLGEDQKALEYLGKALDIIKFIYGDEHPSVGKLYNCISNVYYCSGKFEKALSYDVKILKIRKSLYGEKHWLVASSYYNMALVLNFMKEYKKSIKHHLKALDIYKAIYGEMHPYVPLVYQNIGDIYRQLGDSTKSIQYCLKALDIYTFLSRRSPSQDFTITIEQLKFYLQDCQNISECETKNTDVSL